MMWTSHPVTQITGTLRAPGDKSCSHRALILGGLAAGTSEISGLLEGEDVLEYWPRHGGAWRPESSALGEGAWRVTGVGSAGLKTPNVDLDFGNSGTGSRLMLGVVAGYPIEARFVGDASLSGRPMGRVLDPLAANGRDL